VQALCVGNAAPWNTAALNVLRAAGLGDTIRHRIGHGWDYRDTKALVGTGDETYGSQHGILQRAGIYRPA
jgi:hypothetical protein